jgi:REP element-mobilizing transposase RayT
MFTPHHRRSIRLKDYDYSQSGLYYVTICTRGRECIFGRIENKKMILSETGIVADKCWNAIPTHFPNVVLHEYVIMPNHIHGIIEITDAVMHVGANNYSPLQIASPQTTPINPDNPRPVGTSRTVGSIIRGFKIGVTKEFGFSPWQRNYYEHIIRNGNGYEAIADYIEQNPAKWETDCFYGNE